MNQGNERRTTMTGETPTYQDVRLGFEVTLYINNR
jgi:coenzyme PQQ precursor peptide PqqA